MSIPAPITVRDIRQIDLDRHGLIEASAGTGKTYTIENLVIRLLVEQPGLSLEQILLVTYTEKAAAELKIRIREKIEDTLNHQNPTPAMATPLNDALDRFDEASIQTIHGFCHTLLNDFSFENGSLFQTELIDDGPLYEKALKEQMRSVWPKKYGRMLPQLLTISGFTQNHERFVKTIINVAKGGFYPEAGDRLNPDPGSKDFTSSLNAFGAARTALAALTGPDAAFTGGYGQLNFNARSKKAIIRRILTPLEKWLAGPDDDTPNMTGFAEALDAMRAYSPFKKNGPAALKPQKYNRNQDNSHEACPGLDEFITLLTNLVNRFNSLKYLLATESIVRLQKEVNTRKRMAGSISYDDMLKQVRAALTTPGDDRLLDSLRKRYRYAFVDEFQDTDPIQWQIFARIFLESDSCRLFLIGDPKQAIYSFRGADVFTYLAARFKLGQLANKQLAGCYALNVNYRSDPSLVDQFNRLFADPSWFGPAHTADPNKISYRPADSPRRSILHVKLAAKDTGRAALNLIDLRGPKKLVQAGADLGRFIAAEIHHLVNSGGMLVREKDSGTRPFDLGDIAILVRSRSNLPSLEEALVGKQIPYSYYRKPGLFTSAEAFHLNLLFNAIQEPTNHAWIKKALLTPFFDCRPDDLYALDDLLASHPIQRLFLRWHELADNRRWGELYQTIMVDSGLIFRQAPAAGWDRMEANYNQIIAYLVDVAYRRNFDFARLRAHLDGLCRQTLDTDEKGDIHEIETEQRKVQILTMHQAKGLQFPVVFIAGGLTKGISEPYHRFHLATDDHPYGAGKVIDLTCLADPKRHRQELGDEDKRLFYVALTRAQLKLYVPFFPAESNKSYFGPLCRFVARAIETVFVNPKQKVEVTWLKADIHDHASIEKTLGSGVLAKDDYSLNRLSPQELLPEDRSFVHRSTMVESFSSIHAKQTLQAPPASLNTTFTEEPMIAREDDERISRVKLQSPVIKRPADEIPGGVEVGSMFHDILETIDFATVVNSSGDPLKESVVAQCIDTQIALYNLDPVYRESVARVIADTLSSPIPQIEKNFCLGALAPENRLHEVAFYYLAPPFSHRYIRGVVDLVFRHGDKYYIADWKSNRLEAGYDHAAMAASMDAADYLLQYRLYTVAVLRWLAHARGDRFDPARHFGGVFYFYLRGMGAAADQGIFYIAPESIDSLQVLETSVATVTPVQRPA